MVTIQELEITEAKGMTGQCDTGKRRLEVVDFKVNVDSAILEY